MTPEVLSVLVENHRRFRAFLRPRVRSEEIADELLQAAFVKGIEKGASLREAESAVAWFYRLLRNSLVDHYRREAAERTAKGKHAEGVPISTDDSAELEQAVCACVLALAGTLKPEYADAIRRVDLGGQNVTAYAVEAGITPNNAGVRLHRARQALGKRLLEACGTCCKHGCFDCDCGPKT